MLSRRERLPTCKTLASRANSQSRICVHVQASLRMLQAVNRGSRTLSKVLALSRKRLWPASSEAIPPCPQAPALEDVGHKPIDCKARVPCFAVRCKQTAMLTQDNGGF